MNARYHTLLAALIFIAFAAFVEFYVGWGKLLSPWLQLPWSGIAAAVFLLMTSYWLRAMRLYDYFRADMRGHFGACLKLMLLHNLFNNLLPMRSGEITFPVLMSRYFGVPALRSVPVLLWFRLLDFHTLAAFALIAALGVFEQHVAVGAALALWLPLPWMAFVVSGRGAQWLPRLFRGRLLAWTQSAATSLPQTAAVFWRAWAWTLINWAVKLGVFVWVLGLFVDVPLAAAWLGAVTGDFSSVLPIHGIAGAGTYEAGVVAGLLLFEVDGEQALQGAVNLHLFILGSTLIGGILSLLLRGRRHG